jgi:hypothetical protein
MSKLKLLIAFAAGYVAGAAAGRQRYEQIKANARRVAENPRVQSAAQRATDTVAEKGPVVAAAVKDGAVSAAGTVRDKVSDKLDERTGDETGASDAQPPAAPTAPPIS